MTAAQCPICDGPSETQFEVRSPFALEKVYEVRRCRGCRHRFVVGDRSAALLDRIYGSAFHESAQQAAAGKGEDAASPIVGNALQRSLWLHDLGLRGRLLDVGAGRGYFVQAASRHFDAQGIELSASAAEHARALGVPVVQGDFLTDEYQPGSFDVITLWDVLASLPDPRRVGAKLAQLVRPGGHVVMTVPYGESVAARLSGRFWPLLIPPVNLDYYSHRSLRLLLEQAGFSVREMRCRGKAVSMQFLAVKLARSIRLHSLEKLASAIPRGWKTQLNLHDIVTVVAERIE